MPTLLPSRKSNGLQPSARTPRDSAASFAPNTTKTLAESWADSFIKFETRCKLTELHQMLCGTIGENGYSWCSNPDEHYVHALNWEETEQGKFNAIITIEANPQEGRRAGLAEMACSQKVFTYVATIQKRGMMGQQRSVLVKNVRIFGEKLVIADHMWFKVDRKWEAIEPLIQGQKVVMVGPAIEYCRGDRTKDYTLVLSRVTKLWLDNSIHHKTQSTKNYVEQN